MKKNKLITILLFTTIYTNTADTDPYHQSVESGTIIAYTILEGIPYFLIGKEAKDGTWGSFGGYAIKNIDKTAIDAALREFKEETVNVYPKVKPKEIFKTLVASNPRDITTHGLDKKRSRYLGIVEVPYQESSIFLDAQNTLNKAAYDRKYNEMSSFLWVNAKDLLSTIPRLRITKIDPSKKYSPILPPKAEVKVYKSKPLSIQLRPTFYLQLKNHMQKIKNIINSKK